MTRWVIAAAAFWFASDVQAQTKRPNVLFVAIDDLRDWVGYLGHAQAKTPNLDRLAARSMAFTRSYCAAPVCNPSRTALLTGLRPGKSGVYDNGDDWRTLVPDGTTRLTQAFRLAGYYVSGAGKIWHGGYPPPAGDWERYHAKGAPAEGEGEKKKKASKGAGKSDSLWGYGNFTIGPLTARDQDMPDYKYVDFCVGELKRKHDRPFFLACGITKPHLPFTVPQKWFDLHPLDKIQLPPTKDNDLDDVPPAGIKFAKPDGDHATIVKAGKWKESVQAYLACISFCDAMVGRLIDALEDSEYAGNTIVVLWSDHGWHLGEKQHWRKFALWECATRSPLIWRVPGTTKAGSVCRRTVDFMSLYPTLCDLCGIETPKHVQGKSIRPLLADATTPWSDPGITTFGYKNHAVRTERWRYIRYADGSEELYDHDADPNEWTNLARDPRFADVIQRHVTLLPSDNRPSEKTKKKTQ